MTLGALRSDKPAVHLVGRSMISQKASLVDDEWTVAMLDEQLAASLLKRRRVDFNNDSGMTLCEDALRTDQDIEFGSLHVDLDEVGHERPRAVVIDADCAMTAGADPRRYRLDERSERGVELERVRHPLGGGVIALEADNGSLGHPSERQGVVAVLATNVEGLDAGATDAAKVTGELQLVEAQVQMGLLGEVDVHAHAACYPERDGSDVQPGWQQGAFEGGLHQASSLRSGMERRIA